MKHQNYFTAELSPDGKPTRNQETRNDQQLLTEFAASQKEPEAISSRNLSSKKPAKNNFAGRYGLDFLL